MSPDHVAAPPDPIAADPALVAAARALLGDRIELTATLGTGRTGAVLLGSDLVALRAVAVRVLAPAFAGDEARRARWRDAIALQRDLAGPGLVPILDEREGAAGEQPACAAAVMPLVAGASLAALRPPGETWPIDWARWLVLRAADALARLHAEGIGHGDVRAAAFLVDARGDVVLTDVGVTRAVLDAAPPDDAAMMRDDRRALGRLAVALVAGGMRVAGDDARGLAAALRAVRGDSPADFAEAIARLVHDDEVTLAGVREALRGTLARDGGAVREALAAYARADHRERTAGAVRTQAVARAAAVREVAGASPAPTVGAEPDDEAGAPRLRLMTDGDGRPLMVPVAADAAPPVRGARVFALPPRRTLVAAAAVAVVTLGAWALARRADGGADGATVAAAEPVERRAAPATASPSTGALAADAPAPTPTAVTSAAPATVAPAAPAAAGAAGAAGAADDGPRSETTASASAPAIVASVESLRADSAAARVRTPAATPASPGAAATRPVVTTRGPAAATVVAKPVTTARGGTIVATPPGTTKRGGSTVTTAPGATKRGSPVATTRGTTKRGSTAVATRPGTTTRGTTTAAAKRGTRTRGATTLAAKPPRPVPVRERPATVATREPLREPPRDAPRDVAVRSAPPPAPRARDETPRTPRAASSAASGTAGTGAAPSASDLREEAQRLASTARIASRYADFFADGDDHAVSVARTPTVIGGSGGRVRADFDVRLAKYDAAGRRIVRTATVTMEVARDGAGTRATSVAYGPLRRP